MKIIGSDYDGTLNHGGFDAEKLAAIRDWQAAGNKFGVISGRDHFYLGSLRQHTGIDFDFLIAYNGGMIFTPDGRVIHESVCRDVPAEPFIRQLFGWGCDFVHMCGEKYYKIWCSGQKLQPGGFLMDDVPAIDSFYQISVQLGCPDEAARVVHLADEKYGERLTPLQNGICIDIVPKGVNKAMGLTNVMEYYGAGHDDMIAVGDNINDADMLREFRSYAMESGAEAIKKLATYTTEGVTELIRREL